ncbi:DUF1674 domain-containing protein [Lichenifustis flavocetrariae]|uniref:DUF1674 domain-containing protein n=1 Tax=Lichenifustis flavocetrariae TaxID=2949735 RepID=A0AA41Z548_9HYPH|nr:DUF1674 domain-containing protein [Lichenifustis flavocetrariae]MCW6509462.1 DUF1674 domain-containing protein [Lichenifustis flavocetrariae]
MSTEISNGRDRPSALPNVETTEKPVTRPLPEAAQRALAEAAARRRATNVAIAKEEMGGRGGLDPVRFGDWEVKGLVSDF